MILAQQGALNVTVDPNGQLFVANTATTGSLYANNFNINGGILGLNITQGTSSSTPVVLANTATAMLHGDEAAATAAEAARVAFEVGAVSETKGGVFGPTPDQGNGTVAGGGLAWMITPRVQFDAGFDRRLGGTAPEWQANLGISVYFGH